MPSITPEELHLYRALWNMEPASQAFPEHLTVLLEGQRAVGGTQLKTPLCKCRGSTNGILTLQPGFAPCSYGSERVSVGRVPNPLVVGGSSTQHPCWPWLLADSLGSFLLPKIFPLNLYKGDQVLLQYIYFFVCYISRNCHQG